MQARQQNKGVVSLASCVARTLARLSLFCFTGVTLALLFTALQVYAGDLEEPSTPSKEISLAAFGYRGLSPLSRFTTQHDLTINFIDSEHLLLTYNPKKLIERRPECPPSHKDHMIEARVFDLSSGQIIRQASWYVHDEHAYLWPLGRGHFLLRILNSLYVLDGKLQQKLLLQSPAQILWTSVTPDGKQIIVETPLENRLRQPKKDQPREVIKGKVKIEFLDAESLAVQRTVKSSAVIPLEGTSAGFGDAVSGMSGKIWLARFGPNSRERENITRVRSRCIPNLLFPTNNTMLVGRCSAVGSDYNVSAFTLTGHFLWRQRWSQRRYEPAIQRSEDGSRVAISSMAGTLQPPPDVSSATGEEQWPQVRQKIDVLNAATGTAVSSTTISDAMVSAQNFSLAADGSRLAVVDGSTLRIYDLSPMSTDERAKYVAMQADAPTLAAPSAHPTEEAAASDDEDVFEVASQKSSEEQLQPVAADAAQTTPNVSLPAATTALQSGTANAEAATKPHANSTPQNPNPDTAVPTFRASAKTVVVDVVVTDSKGHPVKDLSEKEFQVFEDGKPQRINYFHEYNGFAAPSAPGTETEPVAAPNLPPNVFANNQLAREDEPVTVLLLDLLNTPPEAQYFAREQLIEFLKNKPKGSQFALCTLANGLRLIQGLLPTSNY